MCNVNILKVDVTGAISFFSAQSTSSSVFNWKCKFRVVFIIIKGQGHQKKKKKEENRDLPSPPHYFWQIYNFTRAFRKMQNKNREKI